MKNKIKIIFKLLFLFSLSCFNALSNDVLIDADEVNINQKGNVIEAVGSVNIKDKDNIQIKGEKAKYDKIEQILEINGNVLFIDKSKNIEIKSEKILFYREQKKIFSFDNTEINLFDKANDEINFKVNANKLFVDQNKLVFELSNNVILNDLLNNFEIFAEKIIYDKSKELVKSLGDTKINYEEKFIILGNDIVFDKNKKIFLSKKQTIVNDELKNQFVLNNFNFNLENKILKASEIKLSDNEDNELEINKAFINLESNEIIGSDFNFNFNKDSFGNSENDPRFFGRYILNNENETTIKKGVFTTCKKVKGKCPAWSISADEVKHDKNKKRIEYKKAWLDIYDIPVAYFPYFFHPDPTVERQSGFLFPQFINSSNLGFSTQLSYFHPIDKAKDITVSPRIYGDNNLFLQSEFRQAFKNSNLITDFSYNKKNNSNSHFFTHLESNLENSFYRMNIETVSNKNYLKKYQIKSPLIKSYSDLNSMLSFEKFSDEYNFSSSINVFEDLTKIDSDKYEYNLPSYEFNSQKDLENKFFTALDFTSTGDYRKYNTNVDEMDIINDFIFSTNNENQLNNLDTNFDLLIRNINTYGNLSDTYKDDMQYKVLGTAMLNLKYPLFKQTELDKNYLTPMASLRYSPSKGMNLKNEVTLITFEDLFRLDRINKKSVEHGASATFGLEYKNINTSDEERFKFGAGMNFKNTKDDDLPISSSLGEKTSDIIGYSGINITENLSLDYNFIINDNLNETNYSLMAAKFNGSNFKTKFEYMEKSNFIGDESYLSNLTELEVNKSNTLSFETNKNLDKNLTNYYNLIYKYKNDCLEASLVYNKQFYNEDNVNSNKNIFFKVSFIPFGAVNTPNLND